MITILLFSAIFIIAILFLFYIPGIFTIFILRLHVNEEVLPIYSVSFGVILYTFTILLLASLGISYISVPLIFLYDCMAIFMLKKKLFPSIRSISWVPFLTIIAFSLVLSLPMILSGEFNNHLRLVGVNARDSLWHIALINELKIHFPPQNPGYAPVNLQGYHFFFNFLVAQISVATSLPVTFLYFQAFPILIAILWSSGVYLLLRKLNISKHMSLLGVFFTEFGGSFGFILPFIGYHNLGLDSVFGMLQPASSLVNPPFSISIVFLVFGLLSLWHLSVKNSDGWIIPVILFFGIVSGFKIYAGIIMIGGLCVYVLLQLIQKEYKYILVITGVILLFLISYWRFTGSSGYLIWYPLWPEHEMINAAFPSYHYSEQLAIFTQHSNVLRIVLLEVIVFTIFLVGNCGTRLVGLIGLFLSRKRRLTTFEVLLLTMMIISFAMPLLFIQSIKVFEIRQLFNYFLFILSIFSVIGLQKLTEKMKYIYQLVLLAALIIFTLPSLYEVFAGYVSNSKEQIDPPYYKAALFLSKQGYYESTVLELPPIEKADNFASIRSWYDQESNPGLLAFSNKRGYLFNEYIDFPGIDKDFRLKFLLSIMQIDNMDESQLRDATHINNLKNQFKKYKITYIYSHTNIKNLKTILNLNKLYEDKYGMLYKVDQ